MKRDQQAIKLSAAVCSRQPQAVWGSGRRRADVTARWSIGEYVDEGDVG